MKKTHSHDSETRGQRELKLYKHRLENVRLDWCKQVLDIINKFNIKSINDLGCNYFQFYKEIKFRKKKYDYFGYDHDKNFVNIGLKKFPELRQKHNICNVENAKIRKADCTVASAILEHTDNPDLLLKKIIKTTKKIVIIRSSFGNKMNVKLTRYKAKKLIYQNTFSFQKIKKIFVKNNFLISYILDEATKFSTKGKHYSPQKKMFFYILLGVKNAK